MNDDITQKKLALLSSPTARQQAIIDYLMHRDPVEIRILEEPGLLEVDFVKLEERIFNALQDREINHMVIDSIPTGRKPEIMFIDEWHSLPSGMLYQRLDRPEPDVPDWKHPIPPQVKGASPGPSERKRAALRAKRKKRSR